MEKKDITLIPDSVVDLNQDQIKAFISGVQDKVLEMPQIDVPIAHYFSFGVYGREMRMPKGSLVVGKIHKYQNLNILSQGEVSVLSIDGVIRVKAPYTFVASPGTKRVIFAHDEVVWTTILGSDEKDPEIIEDKFIAKNYSEVISGELKDKPLLEKGE